MSNYYNREVVKCPKCGKKAVQTVEQWANEYGTVDGIISTICKSRKCGYSASGNFST